MCRQALERESTVKRIGDLQASAICGNVITQPVYSYYRLQCCIAWDRPANGYALHWKWQ